MWRRRRRKGLRGRREGGSGGGGGERGCGGGGEREEEREIVGERHSPKPARMWSNSNKTTATAIQPNQKKIDWLTMANGII